MSSIAQQKSPDLSAVYTIAEAARLCGLSTGRIRRWVRGYSFRRGEEIRSSPPVVHRPHPIGESGTLGLDFLDLIEIRYVKAFLEAGVTWPTMRAAHDGATAMLRVDHPFATKKFFTDGQTILTQVAEPALLDVVGNQLAFSQMIDRYLAGGEGLDFDRSEMAVRWWPMGRKRPIVIDAERSFGQPIVSTEGVPTAVLNRAYVSEGGVARNFRVEEGQRWEPDGPKDSLVNVLGPFRFDKAAIDSVANWYSVEKRSVKAAIEYEAGFLAAA